MEAFQGVARLLTAAVLACVPCALAARAVSHDIELQVGVGHDSNPFLTPREAYYDQNRRTVLDPRIESGFFVPTRVTGDLTLPLGQGKHDFITEYRLKGDIYPNSSTDNANETWAKLEPGFRFSLGQGRWDRVLDVRAFASYNEELYFDRDTGLPSTRDGFDVSNRYTYNAVGAEIELDYELTRLVDLFVGGGVEFRHYRDPGVEDVKSFDHDRFEVEGGIVLRPARSVRLDLQYGYQLRDYSDRHARSLDGEDPDTNPLLEYVYSRYTWNLRVVPVRSWMIEFHRTLTTRDDEFVEYNSYAQDTYRIRSTVKTDRVRWRLSAKYWEREFDNAFIFDDRFNPDPDNGGPNPNKSYETLELGLEGEVAWTEHMRPFAKIEHTDQDAEDPRFDYERTQTIIGLEFTY